VVTKYDLETFMGELETLMKENLNDYMYAIDKEKSDYLLGGFNCDSYYTWSMSDIPPYPMSFFQFVGGDPVIGAASSTGYAHSLTYPIRLTCFILDTGEGNVGKIKARMNRVLLELVQEKIVKTFQDLNPEISKMDSKLLETAAGTVYDIASIAFNVTFAF